MTFWLALPSWFRKLSNMVEERDLKQVQQYGSKQRLQLSWFAGMFCRHGLFHGQQSDDVATNEQKHKNASIVPLLFLEKI